MLSIQASSIIIANWELYLEVGSLENNENQVIQIHPWQSKHFSYTKLDPPPYTLSG